MSSTITDASAPAGMGAPVMIRIASPGPTHRELARARGDLVDHAQLDRRVGDVGRADRVPVDGGVGERRHVLAGDDRLGEHQPGRLVDADAVDGGSTAQRCEHVLAGLCLRDHTPHVSTRSGIASADRDGTVAMVTRWHSA